MTTIILATVLAGSLSFHSWTDQNGQLHFSNLPTNQLYSDGTLRNPSQMQFQRRATSQSIRGTTAQKRHIKPVKNTKSTTRPKTMREQCEEFFQFPTSVERCIKRQKAAEKRLNAPGS